jgi:hypothetical protein
MLPYVSELSALRELMARPKRFELLTPRFVVCNNLVQEGRIHRLSYSAAYASQRSSSALKIASTGTKCSTYLEELVMTAGSRPRCG